MKNLKVFSLAIAMLISFLSFGQENTITGVVSDNLGPLPGANVIVKSTNKGVQTNVDGKYFIKAKTGDILIFQFTGYETKNVTVGKSKVINVKLVENVQKIDEVVVTSFGRKKEVKRLAYSTQKVESKELVQSTTYKAAKALNGKVSGINIVTKNNSTNPSTAIILRGYKSSPDNTLEKINNQSGIISTELNDEDYGSFIENPFESPKKAPLSTFSIDVDNASYTNVRRFINNGQVVPKDAVRVEEMVNFFKYNYPQPLSENPFSINTEYSECPWNSNNKLVRIGLQGKIIETDNLPASNMVFLIDVSGSMSDMNKLPLLKESLKILVKQLRNEDKISMVVYAGAAGLVLPPTSGKDKKIIIDALDKLQSGGSTAGGAGIELAYKVAQENFIKGGNNRVILATDGDFNVGSSSDSDMQTLIEEKRKSGVFLTCLGYGMGNYKDSKLETLADKGNGNYAYIDNIQEANRFLGKEFKGSMFAIAKDVKIQIEFNPKHVQAYRLIGYENRKLRDEDFTNDAIDAGELGSGHTVTALYEIIPRGVKSYLYSEPTDLKYSVMAEPSSKNYSEELATIKFRYKKPDGDKSVEMSSIIANKASDLQSTSEDFKFCASVAWFGLKLRDSKLIVDKSNEAILALANQGLTNDAEGYRAEFIRLVENVRL
ncbi:von Willebrand factor type A domain-containing protein [Flavobacterium sp.]|uniref:vWA domain-containing protein n=1 Tax=Flavobacterium sp. TaxID=239 RepID=UPI0026218544|nr:von Willebrand factor type A domain-containing protein [Flavobacterium sp.]